MPVTVKNLLLLREDSFIDKMKSTKVTLSVALGSQSMHMQLQLLALQSMCVHACIIIAQNTSRPSQALGRPGPRTVIARFLMLFQAVFSLPIAFSKSLEGSVMEMKPATLPLQDTAISLKAELATL